MNSIDEIWARVETGGPGGVLRVDESHPADLYGATDAEGRRGLVLICASEPPAPPRLDAVEVTSHLRHDGRWALGIWLCEPALIGVFTQLCTDLISASRAAPATAAAGLILARLLRWRELLETGTGPMSLSTLRGLVGELLVLQQCMEIWGAETAVSSWVGPLGGPQDFVLPERRVEVKTIVPTAHSVHVSSVDQLDTDDALSLAVVVLATLTGGPGIAPDELITGIEAALLAVGAETAASFRRHVDAVGYLPDPQYRKPMFRLHRIEWYDVEGEFPRVRRADLGAGIDKLVYDVELGACSSHRSSLRR